MIKRILRVSFMFYFYHGECSNNYFEYDTFYNSFIVWFCWNLLNSFKPTANKGLNKQINKFDVKSEERPDLSRKWQIFGN